MIPAVLRKHATTIALLALAAGLGAFVIIDRTGPTTSEKEQRKDNLLPVIRRQDLREIVIEHGSQTARIARRLGSDPHDDSYTLTTGTPPVEHSADAQAVSRLLQSLEFATKLRPVDAAVSPDVTGLEQPRARLTVDMGAVRYAIAVGSPAASPAGAVYVQVQDAGAFVVPGSFASDVLQPIDTYRSRQVLPYLASDLRELEIAGAGATRRFVRGPWQGFRLDDQQGPRVNRAVFDEVLNAFASLNAERFLGEDEARKALDQAGHQVHLTMVPTDGAKPKASLKLGGACPTRSKPDSRPLVVVLRTTPTPMAACVPAFVLDALSMPRDAFIDRKLFDARIDEVEQIKVERGDQKLELARIADGWRVRAPAEQQLTPKEGEGYVSSLLDIEGQVVAGAALKNPAGLVAITIPSGPGEAQPEQRVELGAGSDAGLLVRREQDGVVLKLSPVHAQLLQPTATLLRSKSLLDVSPLAIQKVHVESAQGPSQVLVRRDSGFELEAPTGFQVDTPMAADLFEMLASLQAERWVADNDIGLFGLQKPRMRVRLQLQADAGPTTRELVVGSQAPSGDSYGRWENEPGVFELHARVIEQLSTYALDRSVFVLDPSEVRAVRLKSRKREVQLERSHGQWKAKADAQLPQHSIDRLIQALAHLRAESALHLGSAHPDEGFKDPSVEITFTKQEHDGQLKQVRLVVGRRDVWRNMNVFYARRDGIAATYVMASSRVQPILDVMTTQE